MAFIFLRCKVVNIEGEDLPYTMIHSGTLLVDSFYFRNIENPYLKFLFWTIINQKQAYKTDGIISV